MTSIKKLLATISAVVGPLGFLKGSINAVRNEAGPRGQLTERTPIYEGDRDAPDTGLYLAYHERRCLMGEVLRAGKVAFKGENKRDGGKI